jgi:hypothetical protein
VPHSLSWRADSTAIITGAYVKLYIHTSTLHCTSKCILVMDIHVRVYVQVYMYVSLINVSWRADSTAIITGTYLS